MTRRAWLVATVSAAILYGASYQQFRFFTLADPGGATDAVHYVAMAKGERPSEPEIRHYRWVTPAAASLVMPITRQLVVDDDELGLRLAFYLVNLAFSLVACLALFWLLQAMGFSTALGLLGVCAFASSRITVLVTGTPLVDAGYFCAVALLVCLTVQRRVTPLAALMPVLILLKATTIPFLLLPLLTPLRHRWVIWVGLLAAAASFVSSGQILSNIYGDSDASYVGTLVEHAVALPHTASRLFTWSGVYDLQNGFSLWLPLAVAGAWLNARHRTRDVPLVVVATVPIAFGFALLSGNFGRMFFAAFPAVISFALIAVEHVMTGPAPADATPV